MENRYEVIIKDLDTGAVVKHVKTNCIIGAMYEIREPENGYSAVCLGNASAVRMHLCLKALENLKKGIYEKVPELRLVEQASSFLNIDKHLGEPEEETIAEGDGVAALLKMIAQRQRK